MTSINSLWATTAIEELTRLGVTYFCISPGSRSTPLTVAAARNSRADVTMHFDERGAAFHALGYARATGKPAVLICTSGTAAANYMPAVIEASMAGVPMVLLTADRPPELRETGANQTINQVKLYGDYVRWFFDMPCPDTNIPPELILTTIDQAVHRSLYSFQGPVHINCMFREPLAPHKGNLDLTDYAADLSSWHESDRPYCLYSEPETVLPNEQLDDIADIINKANRGLLLIGTLDSLEDRLAAAALSQRLNWPTLPDITSGVRLNMTAENMIAHTDRMLLSGRFRNDAMPVVCLHLGGAITSKRLLQYLAVVRPEHYLLISNRTGRVDPHHSVSRRVCSEVGRFCTALTPRINRSDNSAWLATFQTAHRATLTAIDDALAGLRSMSEPLVARIISRNLPEGTGLFLASSLPIREMDMFGVTDGSPVRVASNRGASGIDGTIASAAGFAAGLKRPVTLLIGDLAFLHDLNSLDLLRSSSEPVIVVVMNNNGGNIFSFLPIEKHADVFEPYFVTPHDLTFENAAGLFGLKYVKAESAQSLTEAYQRADDGDRSVIIEVPIDRESSVAAHRTIEQAIRTKLGD